MLRTYSAYGHHLWNTPFAFHDYAQKHQKNITSRAEIMIQWSTLSLICDESFEGYTEAVRLCNVTKIWFVIVVRHCMGPFCSCFTFNKCRLYCWAALSNSFIMNSDWKRVTFDWSRWPPMKHFCLSLIGLFCTHATFYCPTREFYYQYKNNITVTKGHHSGREIDSCQSHVECPSLSSRVIL